MGRKIGARQIAGEKSLKITNTSDRTGEQRENLGRKKAWVNHTDFKPDEISIISERIDPAPGTHKIKYSSAIDDIEIIHTAHNRTGFATGAVLAAEFIKGKRGIFSMKDVLGI